MLIAATAQTDAALAWGASGQRLVSLVAARSLPLDVPSFIKTAEAGRQIGEVAREPDRAARADTDPAHFVLVADDLKIARGPSLSALPASREDYDTALRAVGSNEYRAGYLPYTIIDAWQQLTMDFAYWRADIAALKYVKTPSEQTSYFRDQHIREGLTIRDLGILSHFVTDGSEPLRVTVRADKALLARLQSVVARSHIGESNVSVRLPPYRDCQCTIMQRVSAYLTATQKQLGPLTRLENSNAFDDNHENGKAFVEERLAAASAELRDLIAEAWRASGELSIGRPPVALRDIESGKIDALGPLLGTD